MLPAAAQGVIGIECRSDRSDLRAVLANLNHARTAETTLAERTIALALQANCQSPVATFAAIDGAELNLTALVAMPDGSRYLRESLRGATDDAQGIGERLADKLLGLGAAELLEQAASDG